MKLSNETVNVLKNFSSINQNILVKEGNKLRTISTMKNILAEANITEAFPKDFGIYDLNEFLGVLTLVKDAELKFDSESFLTVNGGRTKIKYFFSNPSILTTPPETFNPPECDVSFDIPGKVLTNVLKASAVMQLPDIVLSRIPTDITRIQIIATDLKNVTSNNFTEQLDDITGDPFRFHFKAENFKMIPGDYKVQASTTAQISNWLGNVASYWIAMEAATD
jgi:hypothetical protein